MNTRMKSIATIGLVSALVLFAVSVAPAIADPIPPTPYVINGYVFYEDKSACNGSIVEVNNTNTTNVWHAETDINTNYYELVLDSSDVCDGNILQFDAMDPAGTQFDTTEHTVNKTTDMDNGGQFTFNLTLNPPPPAPCLLLGVGRHPGHLSSGDELTLTARVKNTAENNVFFKIEWQIKNETTTAVVRTINSSVFEEPPGKGPTRITNTSAIYLDPGKYIVAGILHYGPTAGNRIYTDGPVEDGKFTVV